PHTLAARSRSCSWARARRSSMSNRIRARTTSSSAESAPSGTSGIECRVMCGGGMEAGVQAIVVLALDLPGTFVFAVSGVLLAARRNFDITGGLVLGMLTGIGGGMIRDVLLDRTPNALGQPLYLAPAVIATLLIYIIGSHVSRARIWIVAFDAMGLALFSVTGTTIALSADANYPAALLMGALTACGGGLMRDAVASEDPAIF